MAQQPLYRRGRSDPPARRRPGHRQPGRRSPSTTAAGTRAPSPRPAEATLSVISPLQRAMSRLLRPVGNFFSSISNLGSLRTENARLQSEQSPSSSATAGTSSATSAGTSELSKLLRLKESIPGRSSTGPRDRRGLSNNEWLVTINLGSSDGVEVNDPVVGPEGLIGHVVKATRDASDVAADPGPRLPGGGAPVRQPGSRDPGGPARRRARPGAARPARPRSGRRSRSRPRDSRSGGPTWEASTRRTSRSASCPGCSRTRPPCRRTCGSVRTSTSRRSSSSSWWWLSTERRSRSTSSTVGAPESGGPAGPRRLRRCDVHSRGPRSC